MDFENVDKQINEKLNKFENLIMGKNKEIEDKLNILDRNLKMRNLIIHGIEDGEKAFFLLEAKIIKLIKEKIKYDMYNQTCINILPTK